MAEYRSIHTGEKIDEAINRALNLESQTGDNTDKIMSQSAVTEGLNSKFGIDSVIDIEHGGTAATTICEARDNLRVYSRSQIDEKLQSVPQVVQEAGDSTDKVMSQNAVTDLLDTKLDKTSGKTLSSNDFTDEEKEKLNNLNRILEFSLQPDGWKIFNKNVYLQKIVEQTIKSTDAAVAELSLSGDEEKSQKELENWNNITRIVTCDGSIEVYAENKIPDIELNFRIKI